MTNSTNLNENKEILLESLLQSMTMSNKGKALQILDEIRKKYGSKCDYVKEKIIGVESFLNNEIDDGPDRSHMELVDSIDWLLKRSQVN